MEDRPKKIAKHIREGNLTDFELVKLTTQEMAEFEREYTNSLNKAERPNKAR